jgi:hypothetical protein
MRLSENFCADELENTASWRRQKAVEHPGDMRNLEAAELLERLAEEVRALRGSSVDQELDRLTSTQVDTVEGGLHHALRTKMNTCAFWFPKLPVIL